MSNQDMHRFVNNSDTADTAETLVSTRSSGDGDGDSGTCTGTGAGTGTSSEADVVAVAVPLTEEDSAFLGVGLDSDSVDAVATIVPEAEVEAEAEAEAEVVADIHIDTQSVTVTSLSTLPMTSTSPSQSLSLSPSSSLSSLPKKRKSPSGPGFLKRRQLPLSKRKLPTSQNMSPLRPGVGNGDGTGTSAGTAAGRSLSPSLSPKGSPSPHPESPMNNDPEIDNDNNNTGSDPQPSSQSPTQSMTSPSTRSPSTSTSISTKEQLKKFKPSMSRPTLAKPSIVSEKRILLHAGPAESLPPGWTIKHYKRTTGLKHTDRYWFSPLLKKKFRSLAQVGRFLDLLQKDNVNGDETKAWELFRNSPPGPDEIRSRNRISTRAPPNLNKKDSSSTSTVGGGGGGGNGSDNGRGDVNGLMGTSSLVSSMSSSSEKIDTNENNGASTSTSTAGSGRLGSSSRSKSGSSSSSSSSSSGHLHHGTGKNTKHTGHKPWRLPLISSPGLYIAPPYSVLQKHKRQKLQQKEQQEANAKELKSHIDTKDDEAKADNAEDKKGVTLKLEAMDDEDKDEEHSHRFIYGHEPKIELNEQGYITSSLLFDQTIFAAGFTQEKLNSATHKGSSIVRTVDDMFDSDIHLEEMELIPKDLWNKVVSDTPPKTSSTSTSSTTNIKVNEDERSHENNTPQNDSNSNCGKDVVVKAEENDGDNTMNVAMDVEDTEVTPIKSNSGGEEGAMKEEENEGTNMDVAVLTDGLEVPPMTKRRRLRRDELCDQLLTFIDTEQLKCSRYHQFKFEDMIPTSLRRDIPDEFQKKQQKYYQDVKKREKILEEYRNQKDENENLTMEYENAMDEWKARKEYYEYKKRKAKKAREAAEAKRRELEDKKKKLAASKEAEDVKSCSQNDGSKNGNEKKDASGTTDEQVLAKSEVKQELGASKDEKKKLGDDSNTDVEGHPGPEPIPPVLKPLVEIPIVPIPPALTAKLNRQQSREQTKCTKSPTNVGCISEENKHLVMHFDPASFEMHGRYYGLLSNSIADPQYVGPNAPGIAGVNSSGGTGLATTYTGSTAAAERILGNNSNTMRAMMEMNESALSPKKSGKKGNKASSSKTAGGNSKSTSSKSKKARVGPPPTSTSMQLKKIMEKGGKAAEGMRQSIIRAAVYACRMGTHSGSFVGSTGETYPDISKAFSNHAKCRPCSRCKNNKQGAYHCRLKRRHTETDYDGGNSASILAPFFDMTLTDLVPQKEKEVKNGNVNDLSV